MFRGPVLSFRCFSMKSIYYLFFLAFELSIFPIIALSLFQCHGCCPARPPLWTIEKFRSLRLSSSCTASPYFYIFKYSSEVIYRMIFYCPASRLLLIARHLAIVPFPQKKYNVCYQLYFIVIIMKLNSHIIFSVFKKNSAFLFN